MTDAKRTRDIIITPDDCCLTCDCWLTFDEVCDIGVTYDGGGFIEDPDWFCCAYYDKKDTSGGY